MTAEQLPVLLPVTSPLPPAYRALRDVPLIVLVGVTGVGKSTTLAALDEQGVRFTVLPNRRDVTDQVMIEPVAGGPVRDREERFRLTARYREQHPGGMAQALASLAVNAEQLAGPLLFDGLRGLNEVEHAAGHLPLARFVALDAPDLVRVRRLLGRGDAFDATTHRSVEGDAREQLETITGVHDVFTDEDLARLAELPSEGLDPAEVAAKTRIVVTERRNYDPGAANAFLRQLPQSRAVVLDTVALSPAEVARRIREWL